MTATVRDTTRTAARHRQVRRQGPMRWSSPTGSRWTCCRGGQSCARCRPTRRRVADDVLRPRHVSCCMSCAVQQLLVASLNGFADGDGDSTNGPEECELGELGGGESKGVGEFPEWCSSVHGDVTRCLLRSVYPHVPPPHTHTHRSVSAISPSLQIRVPGEHYPGVPCLCAVQRREYIGAPREWRPLLRAVQRWLRELFGRRKAVHARAMPPGSLAIPQKRTPRWSLQAHSRSAPA